ncbi:MAG: hypothetical protein JWN60_2811 [Acidobacteria bacterium]|nr:hypothetical protein [Acidobacteriota bacterium]
MLKIISIIIVLFMNTLSFGQAAESNYRIFDAKGNAIDFDKMLDALSKADAVFLGEQHDDVIAHNLQLKIFTALSEKNGSSRKTVLSLEMFERDVQTVLDEYLKNQITETHFLASSRPWGNYKTDYRPLLEYAKEKQIDVVAANAPRRYVNMVTRLGRDSLLQLSPEAKKWLAPLPFGEASDLYAKKFNSLMGAQTDSISRRSPMLNSQSLWDATMAFSVAETLKRNKNAFVVHLNGSFHTENRLGIVEHLFKYAPNAKSSVVTMRYETDFNNFDKTIHADLGDFVILTDAKVPRSQK